MKIHMGILVTLLLLGNPGKSGAADWTSPDGAIGFARPPGESFAAESSPQPPLLAQWVSNDLTKQVAVFQLAMRVNQPLEMRGLEEGTLNSLTNGTIVSSSISDLSGVPAYTIVASGELSGTRTFLAQVFVAFDGQMYKVVLASPTAPLEDAELGPLLRSLRILKPAPTAPGLPQTGPPTQSDRTNKLLTIIAQIGIFALAGAVIFSLFRKRRRSR